MALYRDHGIVLRTYKLGEADRIVSFVTEHHGKVRAVAKGVRKTKSRFGARLEPTSHVALQLYAGRSLDIVTQAESVDHFKALRTDLDRLTRSHAMLEAVDQLSLEREPDARLYQLLLRALRTLPAGDRPLIVAAFYWKLLALEGLSPMGERCVACGAPEDLVAFDVAEGGVLCRADRRGSPLSVEALELLRQVLDGRLALALEAPEGAPVHELDHLATRSLEHHLERRLKAVSLLDGG